ncbi:MAG: DUF5667 domain-containing protein [Candidatus Limnocylindria bacterium]
MKRITTFAMTLALSFSLAMPAAAQSDEISSTSVFPPDSPLFVLQHVLDAWEELLAVDPLDKAAVQAKIASNRVAEAIAMIKADKAEIAANMSAQATETLQKAAEKLAEARALAAEARDQADSEAELQQVNDREDAITLVLSKLEENLERQQSALQGALDGVENEHARDAITNAMVEAQRGLTEAMDRVREGGTDAPEGDGDAEAAPAGAPANVPTGAPEAQETGAPETKGAPSSPGAPAGVPGRP